MTDQFKLIFAKAGIDIKICNTCEDNNLPGTYKYPGITRITENNMKDMSEA